MTTPSKQIQIQNTTRNKLSLGLDPDRDWCYRHASVNFLRSQSRSRKLYTSVVVTSVYLTRLEQRAYIKIVGGIRRLPYRWQRTVKAFVDYFEVP